MNMIGEQTREFYRRQGELRERERIIKLLKEEQDAANEQTVIRNVLNGVIALIKGENK